MQYLPMKLSVEDRVKNLLPAWLYYPYKIGREARAVEPELAMLRELVPAGCTAIDVGANRGYYSWALSGVGATVEAFEPIRFWPGSPRPNWEEERACTKWRSPITRESPLFTFRAGRVDRRCISSAILAMSI